MHESPCHPVHNLHQHNHNASAIRWLILTEDSSLSFSKPCMKVLVILFTTFCSTIMFFPRRKAQASTTHCPAQGKPHAVRWLILTEDSSLSFSKPCMKVLVILFTAFFSTVMFLRRRKPKHQRPTVQHKGNASAIRWLILTEDSSLSFSKPCMNTTFFSTVMFLRRRKPKHQRHTVQHKGNTSAIRWLILTEDSSLSFSKPCMKVLVILSTTFCSTIMFLPRRKPKHQRHTVQHKGNASAIRWLILTEDSSLSFSKPCMKVLVILTTLCSRSIM